MILPDIVLLPLANCCLQSTGIDSLDRCPDKQYFANYPYEVNYEYNSRGFRDTEWPDDLTDVIWCIGDSFTVGVGSPLGHTWPHILSKATSRRTINISMDGASNNWIARKASRILSLGNVTPIIIHWSYIARRESKDPVSLDSQFKKWYDSVKDPGWPDCPPVNLIHTVLNSNIILELTYQHVGFKNSISSLLHDSDLARRLQYDPTASDTDDVDNLITCMQDIENIKGNNTVVHSFIPDFCPITSSERLLERVPSTNVILPFRRLDWARDRHHYDIKTSTSFVDKILKFIQ